jgi:hypothetical protein
MTGPRCEGTTRPRRTPTGDGRARTRARPRPGRPRGAMTIEIGDKREQDGLDTRRSARATPRAGRPGGRGRSRDWCATMGDPSRRHAARARRLSDGLGTGIRRETPPGRGHGPVLGSTSMKRSSPDRARLPAWRESSRRPVARPCVAPRVVGPIDGRHGLEATVAHRPFVQPGTYRSRSLTFVTISTTSIWVKKIVGKRMRKFTGSRIDVGIGASGPSTNPRRDRSSFRCPDRYPGCVPASYKSQKKGVPRRGGTCKDLGAPAPGALPRAEMSRPLRGAVVPTPTPRRRPAPPHRDRRASGGRGRSPRTASARSSRWAPSVAGCSRPPGHP